MASPIANGGSASQSLTGGNPHEGRAQRKQGTYRATRAKHCQRRAM